MEVYDPPPALPNSSAPSFWSLNQELPRKDYYGRRQGHCTGEVRRSMLGTTRAVVSRLRGPAELPPAESIPVAGSTVRSRAVFCR